MWDTEVGEYQKLKEETYLTPEKTLAREPEHGDWGPERRSGAGSHLVEELMKEAQRISEQLPDYEWEWMIYQQYKPIDEQKYEFHFSNSASPRSASTSAPTASTPTTTPTGSGKLLLELRMENPTTINEGLGWAAWLLAGLHTTQGKAGLGGMGQGLGYTGRGWAGLHRQGLGWAARERARAVGGGAAGWTAEEQGLLLVLEGGRLIVVAPLTCPDPKGTFFLKPTPSQQKELLANTLVDHLKILFSRVLEFFPPLTGRLGITHNDDNTSSFFIYCNNVGAHFIHAAVENITVSDILESVYVPRIVHSFFPVNGVCNYQGISEPLLAVQVTELVDGFFIGCSMNHAVADGSSFWDFFNSWSEISRGLALKAKANAEMNTTCISSLQALLAHLWRTVVRCQHIEANQEVKYVVAVSARLRLQPPLPEGYFGNTISNEIVTITAGELVGQRVRD
ncbi:HXXXD-type acyl-transferase family protein [Actinidia rufa]|uniref:HXXXD-type acyl-transferase family protein n=1 Tax=Actinidia rufa TaxID=165716 RepID=A0A7J0GZB9_9ERIC|nr:HXXXD-type acyl-transferase family protein [Actinidia rufa]